MKRTHRTGLAAAALIAALGVAPAATAHTPVASFNVSQGSSQSESNGTVDGAGLLGAAIGFAQAANGVLNEGVVPTIDYKAETNELNIVLDPSIVPGLSEAFAPSTGTSMLNTSMRGRTASGATVVFPTSGTYTSGFGQRWGAMHNGIDIANPIGTPIVSIMDGTVISSGPAQGFGNWIRVQHDDGSVSVYGHMQASSLLVGVGERVSAGQQIASIGSEGQSTGPHLHFEIHPDGTTPVDPQAWFAEQGINF